MKEYRRKLKRIGLTLFSALLAVCLGHALAGAQEPRSPRSNQLTLSGALVDSKGSPLQHIAIRAYPAENHEVVFRVGEDGRVESFDSVTDAHGRFKIVVDRNHPHFQGDLALCVKTSSTSLDPVEAKQGGLAILRFSATVHSFDLGKIILADKPVASEWSPPKE